MLKKKAKKTYLHIAYATALRNDPNITVGGDAIILLRDDTTLDDIREWLIQEIKTKYRDADWNKPVLLDCHEISETLAHQLEPKFKKDKTDD